MNFQGLAKIEKADWYIDLAFRSANKAAAEVKSQKRAGPDTIKRAELAKIRAIQRTLTRHFDIILKAYPSLDGMSEFYQEMIRAMMDYSELKKALGSINWAQGKIVYFSDVYDRKIKRCNEFKVLTQLSREYYGRVSSVVKQIKKQLAYLEESRKIMRDFPSIKQKLFTVCIAGFPNVGKTTLLSKLTTATPEIANYAFTTKKLNIGYGTIKNRKVQFIDTPGTLDRFEKMNPVEKQAILAIKYCADLIVFVVDPTETYDLDLQKKLFSSLKKRSDTLIFASKCDVATDSQISAVDDLFSKSKVPFIKDIETLKREIGLIIDKV